MSESELQDEIENLKKRVAALEAKLEENPGAANEATDMQSFIREFDPSTHKERAAGIAYYLEEYENQDRFTTGDIEEGYRTCRMNLPANMSDVLNACEENGWVMRDGKEGQSTVRKLTMDGLDMVEEVMADGA
ncbi:hypothetical protein [Haloglomus litoreum]|uniref:hypothetical protein n=1 Tax=Haloglomus litoreum TaxID=3034026 RepID=UPI0023E8A4C8|nr:hypothetical protein [Haloglomus sp. DT116]